MADTRQHQTTELTGQLDADLAVIRRKFRNCSDVVYRTISLSSRVQAVVVFIDGLADDSRIDSVIVKPLRLRKNDIDSDSAERRMEWFSQNVDADRLIAIDDLDKVLTGICKGETAVLMDGLPMIHLIGLQKFEQRSIEEPVSEAVIRGARDGFNENLRVNTTLIRRRLPTADLKTEPLQVGRLSKTDIALVYLDSVVMPGLVDEIKARICRIDIDAVLESGYIEEMICDNAFSIFPQMLNTERPDRVAAAILEGRAAILLDNTPFALIAPSIFTDNLQASEDYYQNFIVATVTRWLRLWLSFSALVFPSIYIAVSTFHQEMIPTSLLLSIASSRENVPFPTIVEALLMEAAFEGLREAGIRLPRPVGQAVSIVGALVIGQAAVQAGIVSATLIIVVSFTGIASFIFPLYNQGLAIRVLRFPMMLLAGLLGLYGIFLGLLLILIHLCKLRSFGIPYLSSLAPVHPNDLKDVFIRAPWWSMKKRPWEIGKRNPKRLGGVFRPRPPAQR